MMQGVEVDLSTALYIWAIVEVWIIDLIEKICFKVERLVWGSTDLIVWEVELEYPSSDRLMDELEEVLLDEVSMIFFEFL